MEEIWDDFCIGEETNMLFGTVGENGYLHTWIIHGKNTYVVCGEPSDVIGRCLLRNGSSYKGALKAAKYLLGNRYMLPIALNSKSGTIILFASESPVNHTCIWFVLHNVAESARINKGQTSVTFTNGKSYAINMNEKQFKNKKNIAAEYRDLLMRYNEKEDAVKTAECDYSIIKEMNRVYTFFHPGKKKDKK